jgi:hypothetical protein
MARMSADKFDQAWRPKQDLAGWPRCQAPSGTLGWGCSLTKSKSLSKSKSILLVSLFDSDFDPDFDPDFDFTTILTTWLSTSLKLMTPKIRAVLVFSDLTGDRGRCAPHPA